MKNPPNCHCGKKAAWWMTGFAVEPHARCTTCAESLREMTGAMMQELSKFDSLPIVVKAEGRGKGLSILGK